MITNEDEKLILNNVNELVQILIELSKSEENNKEFLYEKGLTLINETVPFIMIILDNQKKHLKSFYLQLIAQKLPQHLTSFGDLQKDLDNLLTRAFGNNEPKVSKALETDLQINNPLSGIEEFIYSQYRKEKVLRDVFFRGILFNYYLPERKLAIKFSCLSERKRKYHELLLKKEGITVVEIPSQASSLALRKLPRF